MVKNRILGLVALALGFGLVTIQSAFKAQESRTQYAFHYVGPPAMTIAQVELASNWQYDSTPISCPSGNDQACSIQIDGAYVDNASSAPELSSSAALTAELSDTGKARVTGAADSFIVKNNRQQ